MQIIHEPAASVFHSIASPGYVAKPPLLLGGELMPGDVAALLHSVWSRHLVPRGRVEFRRLRDVFVASEGLILNRTGAVYYRSIDQHAPQHCDAASAELRQALAAGNIASHAAPTVLAVKAGATNYGHWLLEMLPRAFHARRELGDLQVAVPLAAGQLAETITQSLELAGIPAGRVLRIGRAPVHFRELITVTGLTAHGSFMSPLAMQPIEEIAARVADDGGIGGSERVYLARDPLVARCFAREAELRRFLASHGVQVIAPGLMAFRDQVAAMRRARLVCGVMGAAMTNIAFAPQGARVVNVAPAGMPDNFFWFIANLRWQDYVELRVPPAGPPRGTMPYDTDLDCDPAMLAEALGQI